MLIRKQILFVDDDLDVLDGFRRVLRSQLGVWDMSFVSSAAAALETAKNTNLGAVVTDVAMPGMDGIELLTALNQLERSKNVPVIIVTAKQERGLKRQALDLGAADLLQKPVDPEELLARIQSVLRLKSLQDELRARNDLLELKVRKRTVELEDSRLDILWRLAKAVECRDEATGNHVIRVGCSCRIIAQTLGMERDWVERLFLASPLHDIGKIAIPDYILLKPGKLNAQEWEVMKQHCAIGAEILQTDSKLMAAYFEWLKEPLSRQGIANPILEMASLIALTHHEKWDGTGYPRGLKAEEIPIESRIVALADVYDALCSARPYHRALSETAALEELRGCVGRHFDPDLYTAFEKSIDNIRLIRRQFSDDPKEAA